MSDDDVRQILAQGVPAPEKRPRADGSVPGIAAKVAFLRRPEAYPEQPRAVETVETHMSWVFLTDRHAYKLKKPVRHEDLDFSSLELRELDCGEEVRLNRRLTTDVYLGLVALTLAPSGELALQGPGETVDWLVCMRRLPANRMLDELMREGMIAASDVRPAALRLAQFYARAPRVDWTASDYCKRLAEGTRSDAEELRRPEFELPGDRVRSLARAQLAFLQEHSSLFEQRIRDGRLIEGHGDLRPEHICLTAEPAVIDCLEFSRDLRIVDPADELAFLALECERLGRPAVGRWFLDTYIEVTRDEPPEALLRFHRNYRALRRAKIAAWHLQDPSLCDHLKWRERACRYLELTAPPAG